MQSENISLFIKNKKYIYNYKLNISIPNRQSLFFIYIQSY